MSGRGRGKSSGLSLTQDQLQALGIARGEFNTSIVAPPPLFPKLDKKPLPLTSDPTMDYLLMLKRQFLDTLLEAPTYVIASTKSQDNLERYSDKYKLLSHDLKSDKTIDCIWEYIPAELRPGKPVRTKKRKLEVKKDIEKKLKTLEEKEIKEEQTSDAEQPLEDEDMEELDGELEEDYQLDDGTDYANNYFDNGEDFDDEDDALDDGPVY